MSPQRRTPLQRSSPARVQTRPSRKSPRLPPRSLLRRRSPSGQLLAGMLPSAPLTTSTGPGSVGPGVDEAFVQEPTPASEVSSEEEVSEQPAPRKQAAFNPLDYSN